MIVIEVYVVRVGVESEVAYMREWGPVSMALERVLAKLRLRWRGNVGGGGAPVGSVGG